MATLGRISLTLVLCAAGMILQKIGVAYIRVPHEPFDPRELLGVLFIGAEWLVFYQVQRLWSRRHA